MSITSGLAPIRNYANGGDVNTERQNMLAKLGFPSGITNEQLDAAIAKEKNAAYLPESQEPGTTVGQLPGLFKENVFDPTDPVDILTLPFVSLKAAKGIGKFGENIYNKVRGSGGKIRENLRGISAYVGADMLADEIRDDSDPFFTKQEDGTYESTRPLPDAQDEAQEDLEDANKKEEEDKEDKELTKKEKGVKALGRFLESLGDSGSQSSSTPGYMIKGMGAAAPQITRYEEGGIASIDPMMMADGGIAKFAPGGAVIKKAIEEGIEKGIGVFNKAKKSVSKETEKVKKKRETSKKSKSPDRGYSDFLPAPVVGTASVTGKKLKEVGDVVYDYKKPLAGSVGIPAAIAGGIGISQLFKGDAPETPEEKEIRLAKEAQDKLDAEYKERQEAREGLTSMPDIIRARSLERAEAAGRTEPTFVDYVASFPASYSEKISKDPEFAKQMLAGFAAMGKTTEGYVTRNAFTDFTQGVQEERVRQDEGMSDQLKLLQTVQENPDIAKQLKNLNRPEIASTDLSVLMSNVKRKVGDRLGIKLKDTDILVDPETDLPISDLDLAALYNSDGPEAVLELSNRLIYKKG